MEYNEILLTLSSLSNTWTVSSKNITIDSFHLLKKFINNKTKKGIFSIDEQTDLKLIAYHRSLFHFLLYYAYYPKIPFVTFTNDQVVFGSFYGRSYSRLELSFPLMQYSDSIKTQLRSFLMDSSFNSLIKQANIKQILVRDIFDQLAHNLRASNLSMPFQLSSLREIQYQTYDLEKTVAKKGKEFANLRWHLNKFKRNNHIVESVPLSTNIKPVIHLIGSWKKNAIKHRGFSYINVRSDKQAARLFNKKFESTDYTEQPSLSDCIARVLKVDGQIKSFNFGYPIGIFSRKNVFAHAIGIADLSIPHLAEYAQYDFWKLIKKSGYHFVNDGPSWKSSLETYKQKFRPRVKKRYYYAFLKLKK